MIQGFNKTFVVMAMFCLLQCSQKATPWPLIIRSHSRPAHFAVSRHNFHNGQRLSSSVTSLTKDRLRGIMEAFPTSSSGDTRESFLPTFTKTQLRRMKVKELKSALNLRGLSTVGKRDVLVTRLLATLTDDADTHDTTDSDATTTTIPKLDPDSFYRLQVKGTTTQSSSGAGLGLVLLPGDNPDTNIGSNQEDDESLWEGRVYVSGNRTSFEAEYSALIVGIKYASEMLNARKLIVQLSNDAVVYQINGVYDINKPSLKVMMELTQDLQEGLDECVFGEITATQNELANRLSNTALATRKSVNIVQEFAVNDPIEVLKENLENTARWTKSDDPAKHDVVDPTRDYLLRFDGGSRGNPGVAGAGMVIYDDEGQEIWCGWKYLNEPATNNVAEYLGLVYGLKCVNSFGIKKLIAEGDSQLIVRQLLGEYRCKEKTLRAFYDSARELVKDLEYFEIRHIPRAENSRADWLANHAMDLQESHGFDEIQ